MRRFVRTIVAPHVDDQTRLGDIELATSELVTNAVEYGDSAPVLVRVDTGPTQIVVSVASSIAPTRSADRVKASALGHADRPSAAPPITRTGRGLAIVRAVSDLVEVDSDEATLTVTCTFRTTDRQV